MQKKSHLLAGFAVALFLTCPASRVMAAANSGLWVGEIVLNKVNETVSGVNAANQVVSPDPAVTTPVNAPAHMRIIFHVNASGQVRLLKGVAIVTKSVSSNGVPDVALISDPNFYQRYGNAVGSRITAVAYDFGDTNGEFALNQIAASAATAAVNGADALAAANATQQSFQSSPPSGATSYYSNFLQSAAFANSASLVALAATSSLAGLGSLTTARQFEIANGAALQALLAANAFIAADALTISEVPMAGQIAPGGVLTGNIFLGADHPTNPFRHKWNPIHQHGYAITRALTVTFDSTSTNNVSDQITGNYREEISGLHKPLGPNLNTGLIAEGPITLSRISLVDTLNQ